MQATTLPQPSPRSQSILTNRPDPAQQTSFTDLGEPLVDVSFVVVDLETTGGSAQDCEITEVGAIKTRGGQQIGTLETLVNPHVAIPPLIASLTGISNQLVASAPPLAQVLPSFLEFLTDSVLVAHNARFDVGFLKAACRKLGYVWPNPVVVDTVRLARVLMLPDEVSNHKLATLANHFGTGVQPNHRAFADTAATVEVLHALLERAAGLGVATLPDLLEISGRTTPAQRAKRTLADGLPSRPGVYVFRDRTNRPLYVGKSTNIRTRVKSYFTEAETRSRITEMVRIATRVDPIVCATDLEASVREVRLIGEEKPHYNRRSKRQRKPHLLKLTKEPIPRLSVTRKLDRTQDPHDYLGMFTNKSDYDRVSRVWQQHFQLRTCSLKLPATGGLVACTVGQIGSCSAPCTNEVQVAKYLAAVATLKQIASSSLGRLSDRVDSAMTELAGDERYEEAAEIRDAFYQLLRGAQRLNDLRSMGNIELIVAARPASETTWEVHTIKHGRLAGAALLRPGADPAAQIEAEIEASAYTTPRVDQLTSATYEESELILRWLRLPGVRLVRLVGALATPLGGPHSFLHSETYVRKRDSIRGGYPATSS